MPHVGLPQHRTLAAGPSSRFRTTTVVASDTSEVPRSCGDLIRQARAALRRYRELGAAAASASLPGPSASRRHAARLLELTVPLPVDPGRGALDSWPLRSYQESDWPGGYIQKFRALRPVVEQILEGYNPEFLGMLEDAADGVGCWALADTTLVGTVTNATFSSMVKLLDGGYGARPTRPGHTVIAVNAEWTRSADIGQPWSRKLKQRAAELIDDGPWPALYSCQVLRGSRGQYGVLLGELDRGWRLHAATADDAATAGPCLMQRQEPPISRLEALRALADATAAGG